MEQVRNWKISAGLLVGLVAAWLTAGSAQSAEPLKVAFHLQYVVSGYHAGYFAAVEKGWYKQAGLDVSISPSKGSRDTITGVGLGQYQFGIADGPLTAKMIAENDIPIKVVAMLVQDTPLLFMTFADKGIRNLKDFEGKTLGVERDAPETVLSQALLKQQGVDVSKINWAYYNYATKIPSFLAGQVDIVPGYALNELLIARAAAGSRKIDTFQFRDYGINIYSVGIIVNEQFRKEHPDAVRAFVNTSIRALKWSFQNPDEAIAIVEKHTDTSPVLLKEQLMASVPFVFDDYSKKYGVGRMTDEKWERSQALMVSQGLQKQVAPPSRVYTNEYIE